MRINLVTRFADKDKVKALGARWDAARKTWYVNDAVDLDAFTRWIPSLEADGDTSAGASGAVSALAKPSARIDSTESVTTHSTNAIPICGCSVLPWEDCIHTKQGA